MQIFNSVILRSPVESLESVFKISDKPSSIFREGLYISSKVLFKQLLKYESLNLTEKNRLDDTLLKYWIRHCTRCTPFGVFAGCAVIDLKEDAAGIVINGAEFHEKKRTLDMEYFHYLITEFEHNLIVREQILLSPNNSLYSTPLDFRYTETITKNFNKEYKLSLIDKSDYVAFIFDQASEGITINNLALLLAEFTEVAEEEARKFLFEMWDSNLLMSNLQPCITGMDAFLKFCRTLEEVEHINDLKKSLKDVENKFTDTHIDLDDFIELENSIKNISNPPNEIKNLTQTDLNLSLAEKSIEKSIIYSVVKQIEMLMPLARQISKNELEDFKRKFTEKYQDRKISLVIALDSDIGIGYAGINEDISGGNPLIDDISYPNSALRQSYTDRISEYTRFKYLDYLEQRKSQIEITDDELSNFKLNFSEFKFPDTTAILGSIFKKDGVFDDTNFLFNLISVGGSSSANFLGRFTPINEDINQLVKEVIFVEESCNPEIIFAEIVHSPQSRTENVQRRTVLRRYEIPYVGKSGAVSENQIAINDLYLSIIDNEIVLISKRLNKRIVPRLSTAHNFSYKNLPIYKFLCDLQYQGLSSGAIWDWGQLETLKCLPRVVYKNIILKKARWRIELTELSDMPEHENDHKKFLLQFIASKNIPKKTLLVESDNTLLIDFNEDKCIPLFLNFIRKRKVVELEEFLFNSQNCINYDNAGRPYTNELVIPVRIPSEHTQHIKPYTFTENVVIKKYLPGGTWLYLKIFASPNTIDKILKEYILSFVEQNVLEKNFECFFFIRFKENGNHLRIRFYNKDITKQQNVLNLLTAKLNFLIENEVITNIVTDTYVPEYERYGGVDLFELAEKIFAADSFATLRMLNLLDSESEDNFRIIFSMRSVDCLLNDFAYTIDDKIKLLKSLAEGFFNEFGANASLKKNINSKYKNMHRTILSYMNLEKDAENEITELSNILSQRSKQNEDAIIQIFQILKKDRKRYMKDTLLSSYIHMLINRLFINHQRKYELVIYNFLERYYTSINSINNKK